jgi:hypothetical protein
MIHRPSANHVETALLSATLAVLLSAPGMAMARDFATDANDPPSEPLRDGSRAGSEASQLVTGTVPSDLTNPDIDVVRIKCTAKTTICADVADTFYNDNTFHVSVLCLTPLTKRGQGELELAVAPSRPISESACVTGCSEALAIYEAEYNDFSDSTYNSVVSCGSKPFAAGSKFPQRMPPPRSPRPR